MAGLTQLQAQLADVERQIIAASMKADEKVEKEMQRLKQVQQRKQEILQLQQKELDALKGELDSNSGVSGIRTKQELGEINRAIAEAEQRSQDADMKIQYAEDRAYQLEKEVTRLYSILEALQVEKDAATAALLKAGDENRIRCFEEADAEVKDLSLYAQEVQEDAWETFSKLRTNLKQNEANSRPLSEGRSRFEKLHVVASSRANESIPKAVFSREKEKLLKEWYGSWQGHVSSLSTGPASLAQETISRPETPMTPSLRNRPRSVEVYRQKAVKLMSARGLSATATTPRSYALPPVKSSNSIEGRPKTAP
eukprot:TRINITY_DN63285_c0_g1_i1.p1 TRINITY_DN63285_c0_g1~~TRINITY_DN63285_c0_g1_i1.p1  ORF type:complete len:311 (-),score=71.51 TRINITY_DN63285_c0_g1_i1:242-1174(-)